MLLFLILVGLVYCLAYFAIQFGNQTVLRKTELRIKENFEAVTGNIFMEKSRYIVYREAVDENTDALYYIYYNNVNFPYPFFGYRQHPVKKITKVVFRGSLSPEYSKQTFQIKLTELSIFNYKKFLTNHE